jgi:thiamine pyrophosphate-dependent acetolactate synthase large subunit-like protein
MNFPSAHPLYADPGVLPLTPSVAEADVILGLEVQDLYAMTHQMTPINRFGMESRSTTKPGAKIITMSAVELNHKSNNQDFGRYVEADLSITGDAEATLPELVEAVKKLTTSERRRAMLERGAKIAETGRRWRQQHRELATVGWDASPISTARLSAELWAQIKNEDWSLFPGIGWSALANPSVEFRQTLSISSEPMAVRIGYGAPAVGAALANRKHGRLSINIQNDGDLNYAPGVLRTAAHHKIPLLNIMHNNRSYHEERWAFRCSAQIQSRDPERRHRHSPGHPDIDYASIAKGYGLYAEAHHRPKKSGSGNPARHRTGESR